MRTETMRSLFTYKPWTLKTGEDIALGFAVSHHLRGHLVYIDALGNPDFSGNIDVTLSGSKSSWLPDAVGRGWEGGRGEKEVDEGGASAVDTRAVKDGNGAGRMEDAEARWGWGGFSRNAHEVAEEGLEKDGYMSEGLGGGKDEAYARHQTLRWQLTYHLWQRGWPCSWARSVCVRVPEHALQPERCLKTGVVTCPFKCPAHTCRELLFVSNVAQARALRRYVTRQSLRGNGGGDEHSRGNGDTEEDHGCGSGGEKGRQRRWVGGPECVLDGACDASIGDEEEVRAMAARCVVVMGVERDEVDNILGCSRHRRLMDLRVLDLHMDRDEPGSYTFASYYAQVIRRLEPVLEAVMPLRLIVVDDDSIPSAAAAVTAAMLHIEVAMAPPEGAEGCAKRGHGHGERGAEEDPEARRAGQGQQRGRSQHVALSKMLVRAVDEFQRQA